MPPTTASKALEKTYRWREVVGVPTYIEARRIPSHCDNTLSFIVSHEQLRMRINVSRELLDTPYGREHLRAIVERAHRSMQHQLDIAEQVTAALTPPKKEPK